MIVLSAQHITKAFGGTDILLDASLTLQNRERIGLVGVNGCGKSTFLKILTGELQADGGTISMARQLRLGYLAQQCPVISGQTVYQVMDAVFEPVREMEKRLRALEEQMASCGETELHRLGEQYTRLNQAFEDAGGYDYRSRIQGVLRGLGFGDAMQQQDAGLLSGGEQTRLYLARLLLSRPDVLLLDEPTNHLDLSALNWLEGYLADYPGSVVVVSHDRFFLDKVCGGIVEMAFGRTEQYPGNYSRYLDLRAERWLTRERAYDAQQKEIARQLEVIRRLKSFNREKSIKRAESREKMLDKITLLERPEEEKQVFFTFTARNRTGDDVLSARGLTKGFDGRTLFDGLSFELRRGDRVALIGQNGIGKTTLFRIITGETAPDRGAVIYGANVDIGYYDQHQRGLSPEKTILDEVWDTFPRMDQTQIRSALGQFLFSGEDVFAPIKTLSGGERGRVALTELMLRQDNLLLLDEPTNHLDMNSREVLESALEGFEGTILAISHDRYFINRFATRVMELTADGLREYLGNYDDYLQAKAREQNPEADGLLPGQTLTEQRKEKRKLRDEQTRIQDLKKRLRLAEQAVSKAEAALQEYEAYMQTPEAYRDKETSDVTTARYTELKQALDAAYADWEEAAEVVDELEG